jgi:hypothetical protein
MGAERGNCCNSFFFVRGKLHVYDQLACGLFYYAILRHYATAGNHSNGFANKRHV